MCDKKCDNFVIKNNHKIFEPLLQVTNVTKLGYFELFPGQKQI